ncbi:MAG: Adenosylhomocysteinase [Phycisphaerae bacterium]|nr:Adenosylhomocysteinase [Phycisphaerae bacterium]
MAKTNSRTRLPRHDVADLSLADAGRDRIEWAAEDMPVLRMIAQRFAREKPLKGMKMSACLHVTTETANLCRALAAGGADLVLCASNPLSTQDATAAALVKHYGVGVFAVHGAKRDLYYKHIHAALDHGPNVTMDDGADLVNEIHTNPKYKPLQKRIVGSMEETTTGVIRLKAMEAGGTLKLPVVAVNDARCKHLFDNRYGTGQSTIDGVIRATDKLLAGQKVVIAGYGWCGRGAAMRARGMGANVIVTEVDPVRAIEATMDGFGVMPMAKAAPMGDTFITLTGDIHVIRPEHFAKMKDGAVVCNSGHFDVELDLVGLAKMSRKVNKNIQPNIDEYVLKNGNRIWVLAEGRLVNLACAKGHPASVMDMSFAVQALTTEWAVKNAGKLGIQVHDVPDEIDEWISALKLKSMGIAIDRLTAEQKHYLTSSHMGT